MKKIWKTISACALCVPVAALAACGLQDVSDPAATWADFSQKAEKTTTDFAENGFYAAMYQTISVNAVGENGSLNLSATIDADMDATKEGTCERLALGLDLDMQMVDANGEEATAVLDVTAYVLDNAAYIDYAMKADGEEQKDKVKQALTEEDVLPVSMFVTELEALNTSYDEVAASSPDLKLQTNKQGNLLKITTSVPEEAVATFAPLTDAVLGDYEYETECTLTLTYRFNNAGDLLYIEQEIVYTKTVIVNEEPAPEEGNPDEGVEPAADGDLEGGSTEGEGSTEGGSTEGGNTEGEGGNTESEAPETEEPTTPDDNATIRLYKKTSFKDGSTVKLPSSDQLADFKAEGEETPTPDDGDNTTGDGDPNPDGDGQVSA